MSHIVQHQTVYSDLECIKKALSVCGLEFMENQKTYRWFESYIGDYPLPEGMSRSDLGKCTHAARVPNKRDAYELGIVENTDKTYSLRYDFWAGGNGLMSHISNQSWEEVRNTGQSMTADKFEREYDIQVAIKFADSHGYQWSRTADGVEMYIYDPVTGNTGRVLVDLATVQSISGHVSPTTTASYDRRGDARKEAAARLLHIPTNQKEVKP